MSEIDKINTQLEGLEAIEYFPSKERVDKRVSEINELKELLQEEEEKLRYDLVHRALCLGWVETSKEYSVHPRVLHDWHRTYLPDEMDIKKERDRLLEKKKKIEQRLQRKAERLAQEAESIKRQIEEQQ